MTAIKPFETQSVIFCSTQRSGSTMMVDDFSVLTGRTKFKTHENFCKMIDEGLFDNCQWPEIEVQLETLINQERKGLFIENIMYAHAQAVSQKISQEGHDEVLTPFYRYFQDAVWVQVIRIDTLEQAISKYFAAESNIWDRRHVKNDDYNSEIPYDFERLMTYCHWIHDCRNKWNRFFAAHRIKPIVIYYENARNTFPEYLRPVFDKLEIAFPGKIPPRRLEKLGNQRNQLFKDKAIKDLLKSHRSNKRAKSESRRLENEMNVILNSRSFKLSRKLGVLYNILKRNN
jgi:LPS sulfotransferase NodH